MIEPIRWKQIHGFPLYEVSEEGQVRTVSKYSGNGSGVKTRYRRVYYGKEYRGGPSIVRWLTIRRSFHMEGTLYVRLRTGYIGQNHEYVGVGHGSFREGRTGSPTKNVQVADLMDTYWPGVPYPKNWRKRPNHTVGANQYGPYKIKVRSSPLEGRESDKEG